MKRKFILPAIFLVFCPGAYSGMNETNDNHKRVPMELNSMASVNIPYKELNSIECKQPRGVNGMNRANPGKTDKPEVISPQEADIWLWNNRYFVRWTGFYGTAVELDLYEGKKFVTKIAVVPGGSLVGQYSWSIPDTVEEGFNYSIKVISTDDPSLNAASGNFTITYAGTSEPYVYCPKSGDIWEWSSPYNIRWSGFIGAPVKIDLYRGKKQVRSIEKDLWYVKSLGSTTFVVPPTLAYGTNYRIKVQSNWYTSERDFSSYFTVGAPLIVTEPSGCTVWRLGTKRNLIRWLDSDKSGKKVKIELYRGNDMVETIAEVTNNDGRFKWKAPYKLAASGEYRIKVASIVNPLEFAFSDLFQINRSGDSDPLVYEPVGGETWEWGDTHEIKWCGLDAERVRIDLYQGTEHRAEIATYGFWGEYGTVNNGSYFCRIQQIWGYLYDLEHATNYRIKVTSTTDSSEFAFSEPFTLGSPQILITNMPWGTAWRKGTAGNLVEWRSIGEAGSKVILQLYRDHVLVHTFSDRTANDGKFDCSIPSGLSDGNRYRLKITSTKDPAVHAFSHYIDINKSGTITPRVYAPTAGSILRLGATWDVLWYGFKGSEVVIAEYRGSELLWEQTTPNDGSYWYYPIFKESGTDYQIKITGVTDKTQKATSGYFTVHGTRPR
jgi:hypothetical protein